MTKHALINVNYLNMVKYYQLKVFFISGSELPFSFLFMLAEVLKLILYSTHQEVFSLQNYTNMRFHLVHLSGDFLISFVQ